MGLRIKVHSISDEAQAARLLAQHGCDRVGVEMMAPKFCHLVLELAPVPLRAALIIKQEMLSLGGEAALPRKAAALAIEEAGVLLAGTLKQYQGLVQKLQIQPFGLKEIGAEISAAIERIKPKQDRVWRCGQYRLPLGRKTLIMGILNITPDSFSDGGAYLDPAAAIERGKELVAQGADILDIGGESTRPGAPPVSVEEELARLLPVLDGLAGEVAVPISVDTTKYAVAKECLARGAAIINDVSGLRDPRLAELAAETGAGLVVMHIQGTPQTMQINPVYTNVVGEVIDSLRRSCQLAEEKRVLPEQIVIDPGIGFGKTRSHNLELLQRLQEFRVLGYPILLGTSRKSVIGQVLDLPVNERVEGTAATVALGIQAGVDIVRVHDVRQMARVAKMADAIVRFDPDEEAEN